MPPSRALPCAKEWATDEEYVDSLLDFCAASTVFQTLCGGVHILDFFTSDPSLYYSVIPPEWQSWLLTRTPMELLDLFMRDDLDELTEEKTPPESLLIYIKKIRLHSLCRDLPTREEPPKLPRHISIGMIPKKAHEVSNFADYVVRVADDYHTSTGKEITHFVDFGSGQNYLGRTLASPPYNKHIIAVESKEHNINGAKRIDVFAGIAEKEKVMRNKRLYREHLDTLIPTKDMNAKTLRRVAKGKIVLKSEEQADLRPDKDLATIYTPTEGKGHIQYVEHIVQDGDLSDVVSQIENLKLSPLSTPTPTPTPLGNPDNVTTSTSLETPTSSTSTSTSSSSPREEETRLMAISIHSCGNLSHHGIRSLLLNPSVHAISIVGCCYNLLTSRLSPPTYKHPILRPNLTALNSSTSIASPRPAAITCDPHGFPMSTRISTHNSTGIPLNITARMMAVQAPSNWTLKESDSFFTRHFYRALLQKLFLDHSIVEKTPYSPSSSPSPSSLSSTSPIIIGSLPKSCYLSFTTYVRSALQKLSRDSQAGKIITQNLGEITDQEIAGYEERFRERKRELSATWSLMAFSAGVVESLIVVDRWLFLCEQGRDVVDKCWVEPVFEYARSPRNLVIVGLKK